MAVMCNQVECRLLKCGVNWPEYIYAYMHFDPLCCSLKRVHARVHLLFLMNNTKDQIS